MQTDDQLIQTVRDSAFSQQCSPYNIIHLFEGGSGLHGACLPEKGQGKHGQRPELIAAHGYETKAAMHAVRLCGEGIELMQTGFITYPREDRDLLIEVRRGAWSLDKVCSVVSARLAVLEHMYQTSSLQAKPDYDTVNSLLVEMHEEFYN
jgi:hypothetical protein